MEGVNARNLTPEMFPLSFDLATVDVSFISLAKVLPAIKGCLRDEADCIALVKPQFEVGKGEVGRGGIVRDRMKHRRVLVEITRKATDLGFFPAGVIESPIPGAEGNREYLMHLRTSPPMDKIKMDERIVELTSGGET
jgi:23S rRNA (cytidine1920-2'-O)/16S rRNA (cytidine1409-2'-O)-methyltransferase